MASRPHGPQEQEFAKGLTHWGAQAHVREAFTRYLARVTPAEPARLAADLYRSLIGHLLSWHNIPATPGAASWEWAPLYRLGRTVDPHYFTERDLSSALASCPPLPGDIRTKWLRVLTHYFRWRQRGFAIPSAVPFLEPRATVDWIGLFAPEDSWRALDILRTGGLFPLGGWGGYRAWWRYAGGEFAPRPTREGWEDWVALCQAIAPATPTGPHEFDFLADAFGGMWHGFGLEGICSETPRCADCPLRQGCAWYQSPPATPASAAEAAARTMSHDPRELDTATLLQAALGLSHESTATWRERLLHTRLRDLVKRSAVDLRNWLKGLAPGTGPVRALLTLAERLGQERLEPGQPFRGAEDVSRLFRARVGDTAQEHFLVIMLDVRRRFQGDLMVSKGTLDRALVDPRGVFAQPLREQAAAIVVAHNHPSGDPSPSRADLDITERLQQVGNLVGIPLLDHVIVGEGSYISLAEQGLLHTP